VPVGERELAVLCELVVVASAHRRALFAADVAALAEVRQLLVRVAFDWRLVARCPAI
jgi:hypothetical protein